MPKSSCRQISLKFIMHLFSCCAKKKILIHLFAIALMSPQMISASYAEDVPFKVTVSGQSTQLVGSATYVLRNQDELDLLWNIHGGEKMPIVDFQNEMLIGIFAGKRPDPSHRISVKRIDEGNEWVKVIYSEKEARSDNRMRVYPLIMVDPFVVIKIKKTDKFIIFEEER